MKEISYELQLRHFKQEMNFSTKGCFMTDIDGTALYEIGGKIYIPNEVKRGVHSIHKLGRPVILNTLRFPLSIIQTFGKEWYDIHTTPIPTVLLNGSMLGYVVDNGKGGLGYQEIDSYPLTQKEIDILLQGINELRASGIDDIVLFYYPRDWQLGEIIWTPLPERIYDLKKKFPMASSIISTDVQRLKNEIKHHEACMALFLIDLADDKLMAYQHTKKNMYFTREGVDKLSGAKKLAERLGISLPDSIGAGDTELDTFLKGTGMSVHVGSDVSYKGRVETIEVPNPSTLGQCLERFYNIMIE